MKARVAARSKVPRCPDARIAHVHNLGAPALLGRLFFCPRADPGNSPPQSTIPESADVASPSEP